MVDNLHTIPSYIRFMPFLFFGLLILLQSFCVARFNHEEARSLGNISIVRMQAFFKDIHQAFRNNDFYMVYQPQVSIKTNELCGIEALLRWHHPEEGSISPETFIPIAERTDLIDNICRWMINEVTQEMTHLTEANISLPMSLNFSVRNLKPEMIIFLKDRLDEIGISPRRITIEITETLNFHHTPKQRKALDLIRELGFNLSLDDYGVGFSSISRFEKLGFDEIKIDKSFVQNYRNNNKNKVIIQTTIQMGHALGMAVVAEGVEDQAVLDDLREFDCDSVQGFIIAKPMEIHALCHWITTNGKYNLIHSQDKFIA